ncbi:hypothetical protein GE061_003007 [Apolygus lucorum]|uniref:Uncharacterized protein n=1 Tax=Apolygus lucorum TaxID=248454 RepID=A0A6A4JF37_APOLU|nr:hypothetical protein GE061_003007 [Apolygus lucorum]
MEDSNQDNDSARRYPKRSRKSVVRDNFVGSRVKTSQKVSKEEPPAPTASSSGQQKVLKKWKPEDPEKFELCLETYGDQDVALLTYKIQQQQKTPGPTAVFNYLQKHKEYATVNDDGLKLPRQQRLQRWMECIREKKVKLPQPNPTALSMLLISLLEDHPVPTDSEVNFAEAYEYLFELLSGRNFIRHKKYIEGKYSGPTLKFIRLTVLSLLKDTVTKMDVLHDKFVQSANDEAPISCKKLDNLPDHIEKILQISHFNPLGLNEDALTLDEVSAPGVSASGMDDTFTTAPSSASGIPDTTSATSSIASGMPDTNPGTSLRIASKIPDRLKHHTASDKADNSSSMIDSSSAMEDSASEIPNSAPKLRDSNSSSEILDTSSVIVTTGVPENSSGPPPSL